MKKINLIIAIAIAIKFIYNSNVVINQLGIIKTLIFIHQSLKGMRF